MPLDPNDSRLTDYALGELDAEARAELERELVESPEAREALAEIERTVGLIGAALAEEDQPALDTARREAILAAEPSENGAAVVAQLPGQWRGMTTGRWISAVIAAGLSGVILTAMTMQAMHKKEVAARALFDGSGTKQLTDDLSAAFSDFEKIDRVTTNFNREQESLRQEAITSTPLATATEGDGRPVAHREPETKTKNGAYLGAAPGWNTSSAMGGPNYTVSKPVYEQGPPTVPADDQERLLYPDREMWRRLTKSRDKYVEIEKEATGRTATSPAAPASGPVPNGVAPVDELAEQVTNSVEAKSWTDNQDRDEGEAVYPVADLVVPVANEPREDIDGRPTVEPYLNLFGSEHNTESYAAIVENPFKQVMQEPLSTFSIDVDTASYANVRRFLTQNTLPPPGAVRLEEMINYFSYEYAQPTGEDPFAVHVEVAQCPWEAKHRLVRIGIAGREMAVDQRPASNLVFLIDVSGSMQPENRLPLVKTGLRLLTEQLSENDRVAMVVYAGSSGQVLASTPGNEKEKILAALDQLEAGGSTNGAGGIEQAYQVAVESFIKGGANRVILCTDGDFNVGVTDESQLVNLIEGKAKSGVFLSVLGFGMGNLKDSMLEKLSDKGNGNYAYIDTEREARKVLVEQLSGTLVTIAKDVKLQLEFNPAKAAAYRLIGYENRLLAKEDFNDDTKDAGEIGAGHTVTALYEVIPAGEPVSVPVVDALEYQSLPGPNDAAKQSNDLLMLKLRYKQPDGDVSKLIKTPVADSDKKIGQASADYQFAASVAAFGMLLRHSPHAAGMNYGAVLELAQPGLSQDKEGYRAEFVELVKKAQELSGAK